MKILGRTAALLLLLSSAAASGDPVKHHFDAPAEEYAKKFDDPKRDAWQKPAEIIELMGVSPGMILVDIGAGTGYFLPHLSRATGERGRVLAIDVEKGLTEYMDARARREKLANVTVRLVPRDDPQLVPGSVDRVLIVDTWHHIGERDAYTKKLAAGLAPGGRVVIVEVTKESPHGPAKKHRLEPAQVVRELEAAGLRAEIAKESLPRQYVVLGHKPR